MGQSPGPAGRIWSAMNITFDDAEILDDGETFAEGTIGEIAGFTTPWIEKPARLFRAGVHRGKSYTEADLDTMASSVTAPKTDRDWAVPVQLDHSESARDTVGNVRRAWREGSILKGVLRFVGAEAVEKSRNGTWKRLSVGLRPNLSLREVSVTPFPFFPDTETFKEDIMEKETTKTEAAPQADKGDVFAERLAEMERQFAERTAKLEADAVESRKMIDAQQQLIRFTELTALVDKFSETGKTVPVMRDAELAFVKTLSEEQVALFSALKATQPKFIDLTQKGYVEFKKAPHADASMEDAEDEAEKLAADFNLPQVKKTKAAK